MQPTLLQSNSLMPRDELYSNDKLGDEPFRFDETVARVFPDMLRRSIPGYASSLETIGSLAARFVDSGTCCYDLGCSLGAATLAIRQGIRAEGCRIVAVDNAPAMIERCREVIADDDAANERQTPVNIILGDIRDIDISNASLVVLNYTLQFLSIDDRDTVIQRIFDGLNAGGVLLMSEKVVDEDPHMEALLVELYHEFKRRNDYSALEIARKRAALEEVLIPESVSQHRARLESAGFRNVAVWMRNLSFVSIIAVKQ